MMTAPDRQTPVPRPRRGSFRRGDFVLLVGVSADDWRGAVLAANADGTVTVEDSDGAVVRRDPATLQSARRLLDPAAYASGDSPDDD